MSMNKDSGTLIKTSRLFYNFIIFFFYHNYYFTMGNIAFKRIFQLHIDPDEILTESK